MGSSWKGSGQEKHRGGMPTGDAQTGRATKTVAGRRPNLLGGRPDDTEDSEIWTWILRREGAAGQPRWHCVGVQPDRGVTTSEANECARTTSQHNLDHQRLCTYGTTVARTKRSGGTEQILRPTAYNLCRVQAQVNLGSYCRRLELQAGDEAEGQ